ncbi:MAG TPA: YceI family protein, partial [Bacteroidales bacterium]|nr:YceI family protein [Bacteroidales bacterium]
GSVVIDMTTIVDTDIKNDGMRKKLEEHLRSDDFFGVSDHPEAVFSISSSEKTADGIKVKGDLTIKGKTQPYEFLTQLEETEGGFIFKGKMDIDRTLFDVRYGSKKFFAKIGDRAIDDIFTLEYELYLKN